MPSFGPSFHRHHAGQRQFSARRMNAPLALLERIENFRAIGTTWMPSGPVQRGQGTVLRIGMTSPAGIPASSAQTYFAADVTDCYLLVDTTGYKATLSVDTTTFPGFNLSSQPVAGNTLTLYELLWGLWVCTWEDCPSQSGS